MASGRVPDDRVRVPVDVLDMTVKLPVIRRLEQVTIGTTVAAFIVTMLLATTGVAVEANPVSASALSMVGWMGAGVLALTFITLWFHGLERVSDERLALAGAVPFAAASALDLAWNLTVLYRAGVPPVEYVHWANYALEGAVVLTVGVVLLVRRPLTHSVSTVSRPSSKFLQQTAVVAFVAMLLVTGGVSVLTVGLGVHDGTASAAGSVDWYSSDSYRLSASAYLESTDTFYAVDSNGNIRAYDPETGEKLWQRDHGFSAGRGDAIAYNPASGTLVVADGADVRVIDPDNGDIVGTESAPTSGVHSITIKDGIIHTSTSGTVGGMDAETFDTVYTHTFSSDGEGALAVDAEDTTVYGSDRNGNVYSYDWEADSQSSVTGYLSITYTLAFTDGYLYIGAWDSYDDGGLRLYDTENDSVVTDYSTSSPNSIEVVGTDYVAYGVGTGHGTNGEIGVMDYDGNVLWTHEEYDRVDAVSGHPSGDLFSGSHDSAQPIFRYDADSTLQARINGTVTDSGGSPLPDATVTVTNSSTGDTAAETTTDDIGTYNAYVDAGTYDVEVDPPGYEPSTQSVDVPSDGTTLNFSFSSSGDSNGYRQEFELVDHTGEFGPDTTLEVDESLREYGITAPAGSNEWTTIKETSFNHNKKAYVELEESHLYRVRLREGGAAWQRAGINGDADRGAYVLEIGNETNTTATATPLNTSDRPNVTVIPYDGGIRVTYDGEPLEDFEYDLTGPDGSVYNVSRDFSEPTDWFQSDLNDTVTENASENSNAYTIDWAATTSDGDEQDGNVSVGENSGLSFGGSSGSSSSGGGGGIVPAGSGSGAPIWLTAVPALAGIGYVVYRNQRGGL